MTEGHVSFLENILGTIVAKRKPPNGQHARPPWLLGNSNIDSRPHDGLKLMGFKA